jgi:hypothetical protein
MTKAELLTAMAALPDDAEILIEAWPDSGDQRADLARLPVHGELYGIGATEIIEGDELQPPFFTIQPELGSARS